jgi:hypothetical protein
MPHRIPEAMTKHHVWQWIILGSMGLAVIFLPYNAANLNQNAAVERCHATTEGARVTGTALRTIIAGNQTIADDDFQSAKTRLARQSENSRLLPAAKYYEGRAALDCHKAFPEPPLFGF